MKSIGYFCIFMAIFMAGFIYYVSSLQFPPPPPGVSFSAKAILYHMSVFFLLASFLYLSVMDTEKEIKKIILSTFILIVYSALDELHQFFVPGRYTSIGDFFIDYAGITLALIPYLIMRRNKLR